MIISQAHRATRNQASIDLADQGAGNAAIHLYTEAGGTLLAVRTLAKPCAALTVDGRISLQPAATPDLVAATGIPTWGEWCDGAGVPIWGAAVTGADGSGPFKLAGTAPNLTIYEGGIVALATPALLG